MMSPDTPSEITEAVNVHQKRTTSNKMTYTAIVLGTEQNTLDARHRIIRISESSSSKMDGTSDQLDSIGIYKAVVITVLESTNSPGI